MSLVDGGGGDSGSTRKTHITRIYKNDDPDTGLWVDIERIDELTYESGTGFAQQTKRWKFDWSSFDPNGDGVSKKKIQDPNDDRDPNDPDASVISVPVRDKIVVTQGADQQYQQYNHFFVNDNTNSSRKTHSRRVYHYDVPDNQLDENKNPPRDPQAYLAALGAKDDSQYVQVEIIDSFLTNEYESRDSHGRIKPSAWQEKKWLVDSAGDTLLHDRDGDTSHDFATDGTVDPPWRLDPLQNIVNVQLGQPSFFVVITNVTIEHIVYWEYIGFPDGPFSFPLRDISGFTGSPTWKSFGEVAFDDGQHLLDVGGGIPAVEVNHYSFSIVEYNNPESAFYDSFLAYENTPQDPPGSISGYVTGDNVQASGAVSGCSYFISYDGFNWTETKIPKTTLTHTIELKFQKGPSPVRILAGAWLEEEDPLTFRAYFLSSSNKGKTWTEFKSHFEIGAGAFSSAFFYSPSTDKVYIKYVPPSDVESIGLMSTGNGMDWKDLGAGADLPTDAVFYGTTTTHQEPIIADPKTQFSSCYNPKTGTTITIDKDRPFGESYVTRITKDGKKTKVSVDDTRFTESVVFAVVRPSKDFRSESDSDDPTHVFIATGGKPISFGDEEGKIMVWTSVDDGQTWEDTLSLDRGNYNGISCSGARMKTIQDTDGNRHVVSG